jgi:hypothetical protein
MDWICFIWQWLGQHFLAHFHLVSKGIGMAIAEHSSARVSWLEKMSAWCSY